MLGLGEDLSFGDGLGDALTVGDTFFTEGLCKVIVNHKVRRHSMKYIAICAFRLAGAR